MFLQANLGLLKVLVAKSQAEAVQAHLRSMVEGVLNWQDSSKNHFKAKVSYTEYKFLTVVKFELFAVLMNLNVWTGSMQNLCWVEILCVRIVTFANFYYFCRSNIFLKCL